MLRNSIRTGEYARIPSKLTDARRDGFRVHAILVAQLLCPVHSTQDDAIAKRERLRQRLLEHSAAHGIRARFQNGPQTPSRPTRSRRFNRGLHGGGVMREIIDDQYSANLALHIHAALNAAKCAKRFGNMFRAYSPP